MRSSFLLFSLIPVFAFSACVPDDDGSKAETGEADADTDADADADADSDADSDADTDADAEDITGSWHSEGEDLSDLFQSAFFDYSTIDAQFAADGTYVVNAVTNGGEAYEFVGTYTTTTDTEINSIVLTQTAPIAAVAEGIWQIEGEMLTYEVVQTDPNPNGFVAPTPETGFGSTSGPGIAEGANIQIYRRN